MDNTYLPRFSILRRFATLSRSEEVVATRLPIDPHDSGCVGVSRCMIVSGSPPFYLFFSCRMGVGVDILPFIGMEVQCPFCACFLAGAAAPDQAYTY